MVIKKKKKMEKKNKKHVIFNSTILYNGITLIIKTELVILCWRKKGVLKKRKKDGYVRGRIERREGHRRGRDGGTVDPWGRNWFRIRITRPSQNRSRIYIRSRLRRIDPPRDHSYGKCGSSILPTLNSLFFVSLLSSRQPAPLRFSFYFYTSDCVMALCISSNAFVSPLRFTFLIVTNGHLSIFHLKSIIGIRKPEIRVQFYIF